MNRELRRHYGRDDHDAVQDKLVVRDFGIIPSVIEHVDARADGKNEEEGDED